MNINRAYILLSIILLMTGCFSQHKLDFDQDQFALKSCDERIKIKQVNVRAVDDEGIGYEIKIREGKSGSNIIYLNKYNEGYYTNDDNFKIEPDQEYIITSVQGDSGLEMRVFTNSQAKVDSVLNDFSCSE